ncbi:SRPBCC family protein [Arthrobacter glacialis]|uniref:SRPBCC family protein n=1 Tax=Arthrobacter glacialis TaxID=1664 RepID=UPI001056E81B|nr:hypothetical protein [Arthrobacter glacialis]
MGYSSFSNSGYFSGRPETLWASFVDPAISAEYVEHKTTFFANKHFALEAGNSWSEHHGEECDFDVVTWTITNYVPESTMDFHGKQRGIRQRVRMTIEPVDAGYRLTETIRFSPAFKGKFGPSVLSWLLLVTGLLAKFGDDKGESLARLQDYLDGVKELSSQTDA